MKALVRNPGETVTEADNIPGIDWNSGMPLTCSVWAGGPYTLVTDYVSPESVEGPEETQLIQSNPSAEQDAETLPETVTIDGKTYTKDELLALLNQTS